jgi:carboxyl-terminal processing protease
MHKDLFTALENHLAHSLDEDMKLFRKEITGLLEDEIISRYLYEDGAIAWTLKDDEQVAKAVEVLNNKNLYTSILKGEAGSVLLTRKNGQKSDDGEVINPKK